MARVVVIGGIESTFSNAQALHDHGDEIVMFYTRGPETPGWEGVALVDESRFPFAGAAPRTVVERSINDHVDEIAALRPEVIYSLGWQQIYSRRLLELAPVVGIHESLLPAGAGAVPLANAILHDLPETGCTLFWLDGGVDTGPIIGQRRFRADPRTSTSSELYAEAMEAGAALLREFAAAIAAGSAPRIPQDPARRTLFGKVRWEDWPADKVARARTYPYA